MAVGVTPDEFFDLAEWELAPLFAPDQPVWTALLRLSAFVAERTTGAGTPAAPAGVFFAGDIVLGRNVTVEPGAYVQGPAIIEDGATLRQGCYLRGNVIVGAGAVVGHASELKHAVLLPGGKAPHFNYVGDSLIGRGVNLGAGTICSNVTLAGSQVTVRVGRERHATGLRKLGAILGDGCETGCHVVLNPGTLAGRGCRFYPGASVAGWFPPGTTVTAPVARAAASLPKLTAPATQANNKAIQVETSGGHAQ